MKLSTKTIIIVCLLGLSGCGWQSSSRKTSLDKPLYIHNSQKQSANKTNKTPSAPPEAKRKPEYLTFDQLKIVKEYYITTGKYELAIQCAEQMLKKTSDVMCLQELRLELCDLYFETGQLEQASKLYIAYGAMYPGSEHRVYAPYQNILCCFYLSLNSDLDQTATNKTLVFVHDYLEHCKKEPQAYDIYRTDVENIKKQCCQKLYESDLNVYDFYLGQGNYKACQVQLENMQKRFTLILPDRLADILQLECFIAEKSNQPELLTSKMAELKEKHAEQYSAMILAQAQPRSKPAIVRF